VQRGNPAGITDLVNLCGREVAVERDTVQVDLLRRSQGHCGGRRIRIQQHPTNADALVQLRTGRAVAVLNDFPPAAHLVSQARTRARFQLASTEQYEPDLYGIAVSKHAPALREVPRRAVDELIAAGVYRDVLDRWGVSDGAVDGASVNAGGGAGT
jgi:polar amino acid transport system substrate-binding protein